MARKTVTVTLPEGIKGITIGCLGMGEEFLQIELDNGRLLAVDVLGYGPHHAQMTLYKAGVTAESDTESSDVEACIAFGNKPTEVYIDRS